MASCEKIRNQIQALLDGETANSEKLIIEQHLEECRACRELHEQQRSSSAYLYDLFRDRRLNYDMTKAVLAHLPEMELDSDVAHTVTWRAKHPRTTVTAVLSWLPAFAAVLIVVSLSILVLKRDATELASPVGMVTGQQGSVLTSKAALTDKAPAEVCAMVGAQDRFETDGASRLLIGLAGRSYVKADENTRFRVTNPREVIVEKGQAWFDVAKDAQRSDFRVVTPDGAITVFGTIFNVQVRDGKTIVTVVEGEVQVENDRTFTAVKGSHQVEVALGMKKLASVPVADVKMLTAWASTIQPDPIADKEFKDKIVAASVIPASQVFVVEGGENKIRSIEFHWENDQLTTGHCGYHVYISDDRMNPLVKCFISPDVFNDPARQSYEVAVSPEQELLESGILHISVLPDYRMGTQETQFVRVYGLRTPS